MSIPPPGWHRHHLEDGAAPQEVRPEPSSVRRLTARAFRVLLVAVIIAIVAGFIFFAFMSALTASINGPE